MKKLIAGLFTAILTIAGLVVVASANPASADCTQYVCNATTTNIKGPKSIKAGNPAKVKVSVQTRGSVEPRGKVTVTVVGPGGYDDTMRSTYDGDTLGFNLGKLKKAGKYKVKAAFNGAQGFRDSTDSFAITVKKKN